MILPILNPHSDNSIYERIPTNQDMENARIWVSGAMAVMEILHL